MRLQSAYIAAAANRASYVADGGALRSTDGSSITPVLAFASHKSVAIWERPLDSTRSGASELVPTKFRTEITALQGVFSESSPAEASKYCSRELRCLIAGSRSGELALIRPSPSGWASLGWTTPPNEAHTATVTTVCALQEAEASESFLIVTGSADGLIRIWRLQASGITLLQTISTALKGGLPLCVQLTRLGASLATPVYLLAIALTKSYIQLWACEPEVGADGSSTAFSHVLQLSGHEDWVRALAFAQVSASEIILASGGQDNYIRLWRIARHDEPAGRTAPPPTGPQQADDEFINKLMRKIELGDENEDATAPVGTGPTSSALSANSRAFSVGSGPDRRHWVVTMDALLVGHDGWITSLRWHPIVSATDGSALQPAAILSTSADNSVIIWTPAETSHDLLTSLGSDAASSSIWAPKQRFGELGGGSSLGFYGGTWVAPAEMPAEEESSHGIFCHAFNGATRIWAPQRRAHGTSAGWEPRIAITGHLGPCKSLSWDPTGCMLLSCGSDRTTRLHARYRRANQYAQASHTWHEWARPQTHGYDLNGVCWLDQWSFASAADEKVVRVFTAPASFAQTIQTVGGLDGIAGGAQMPQAAPIGASVPPLGLSNRAIFDSAPAAIDEPNESGQPIGAATTSVAGVFQSPPNEDELHVSTLWPELDKLYGHGYELFAIGASRPVPADSKGVALQGRFVASSCKATNAEHSVIRIHDREKHWKEVAQLAGHKLSITRIRLHPGGAGREPNQFILSSGRDRSWHLHECSDASSAEPTWKLVAAGQAHTRIVWDCAWNGDGTFFATASRDKTVKIWMLSAANASSTSVEGVASLKFASACTSVAFGPDNILAVGLEHGSIELWQPTDAVLSQWSEVASMVDAHTEAVQELAFRPGHHADGLHLASTSDDGSVRIFVIRP